MQFDCNGVHTFQDVQTGYSLTLILTLLYEQYLKLRTAMNAYVVPWDSKINNHQLLNWIKHSGNSQDKVTLIPRDREIEGVWGMRTLPQCPAENRKEVYALFPSGQIDHMGSHLPGHGTGTPWYSQNPPTASRQILVAIDVTSHSMVHRFMLSLW